MNTKQFLMTTALMLTLAAPAFAQDNATPPATTPPLNAGTETQRNVNQQNRTEQGLKSGQLSTGEAARIEKGEAKIDKTEAKDMKDGKLSPREKARLQRMQNRESRKIYNEKHNDVKGNPNSASSQRMQKDVQRDANQQQRIHNGVTNASLTNKEAGKLQRDQAGNVRVQANSGMKVHMGAKAQRRIERRENRSSGKIYQQKHNQQRRNKNKPA